MYKEGDEILKST